MKGGGGKDASMLSLVWKPASRFLGVKGLQCQTM